MKKGKQNRVLVAVLTLSMVFSMCGMTASAETNYGIRINHGTTYTVVTSGNAADVLGDGTVSYDADTNTLTLDNANLTYVNPGEAVISVYDDGEALNLNLVGQNTITAESCIYVKPDLVITGEGHLEMQSTRDALCASNNLTIDGPTINAKVSGGNITGTFTAIKANQGVLTIKNSKNVSASNPTGTGISGSGGVEIVNSHIAASTGYSFALLADGKGLTITDSAVDVFNSNGIGMFASDEEGGIKISRSTVSATTTGESTYSIGTNYNVIEISDSKVTVTSEGSGSNGILAGGSLLICDQSNVTAFGTYPAVYSQEGTTISDSTVEATALEGNAMYSLADISIKDGAEVTVATTAAEFDGIYSKGRVSISNQSKVTAFSPYPSVCGDTGITISDSTVVANSSEDAALFSRADIRIENGADVTAYGYWPAIRGNENVTISDSKVDAISREDVAIFAPNNLQMIDSIVSAKGKDGFDGIKANNTVEVSGSWISTSGNETFAGSTDYVLINGVTGTVIGDAVLPDNVTIPADTTIQVPSNSSLTIPESVTLTNDGTVNVEGKILKHGIVICNNHNGGTATCTTKATCGLCGQEYGSPNGHKMQKMEPKAPTCTEAGNVQYWHCTVCDKNFADEQAAQELDNVGLPASGHQLQKAERKEPTCTESGSVQYWHCTACDKNFADEQGKQEIANVGVPASGHKLEKVEAKVPTCTEVGNVEYWHCTVCDKNFADEQAAQELDNVGIPATGHTLEKVDAKEPTCTESGNVQYWHCTVCDKNFADEQAAQELDNVGLSASGHQLQKVERKEPACTEAGNVEHWHCTVCDKNFADAQGKEELDNVGLPASGHKLEKVEAKAPTCTEAGNVEHWHCTVCDKSFADAQGKEELTKTAIAALGHKAEKVEAKTPTCTEAGNVEYWHCTVCNKNFADAQGKEELTKTVIAALGHKAEKVEAKEPTATEPGNIEYWHCPQCGQYFKDADLTEIILKEDTVLGATGGTTEPEPEQPTTPSEPEQPTKPSEPSQPAEPPKETPDTETTGAIPTGDNASLVLWIMLIGMGIAGGAGTVYYGARRKDGR